LNPSPKVTSSPRTGHQPVDWADVASASSPGERSRPGSSRAGRSGPPGGGGMGVGGGHLCGAPRCGVDDPHRRVAGRIEVARRTISSSPERASASMSGGAPGSAQRTSAHRTCSVWAGRTTRRRRAPRRGSAAGCRESPVSAAPAHRPGAVGVGVVGVARPRLPPGFRGGQRAGHGRPVPEVVVGQWPADGRDAGPVAQRVPDGGVGLARGGELGPHRRHRVVESQPALVDELQEEEATNALPTEYTSTRVSWRQGRVRSRRPSRRPGPRPARRRRRRPPRRRPHRARRSWRRRRRPPQRTGRRTDRRPGPGRRRRGSGRSRPLGVRNEMMSGRRPGPGRRRRAHRRRRAARHRRCARRWPRCCHRGDRVVAPTRHQRGTGDGAEPVPHVMAPPGGELGRRPATATGSSSASRPSSSSTRARSPDGRRARRRRTGRRAVPGGPPPGRRGRGPRARAAGRRNHRRPRTSAQQGQALDPAGAVTASSWATMPPKLTPTTRVVTQPAASSTPSASVAHVDMS